MQLERDPQRQIAIEGAMVRVERPRGGAPGVLLQDGVSTSMKPCRWKKRRTAAITSVRARAISRERSFAIRSRWRWR